MERLKHQTIFDFKFISDSDHQTSIDCMLSDDNYGIKDQSYPFLITPNVDQIVKFSDPKLKNLRHFYENSAYIFPDGQPIVWSSKLLNKPLKSRLTGSDFFPKIWQRLKAENKKVFLIVPTENIAKKLENEYAYCQCFVPPFFKVEEDQYGQITNKLLDILKLYRPDFLFIGLGFPKQEILAKDLYTTMSDNNLHIPFTLLLGASFAFYTGEINRAPRWMHKIGMEWFYRFIQEPKRMFKRYFIDDLKFIFLVFKEKKY